MASAVTRLVIVERDVEFPVHALDPPVASRGVRDSIDVERRGTNIDPSIERASVGEFSSVEHVNQRLYALNRT